MKFNKQYIILRCLILLVLSYFSIVAAFRQEPYATGDAPEYLLMTEALVNHFSPDIRISDVESFLNSIPEDPEKFGNYKLDVIMLIEQHISQEPVFMEASFGFFTAKNDKHYSYHFYFFSLVNVPARIFTKIFNIDPIKGFMFNNALFVIFTCGIILFFTPFNLLITALIAAVYFYTSNFWYLSWIGSEVFSACFIAIGVWLYFQKKYYAGIFFTCIASLQNQPIALFALFMCLHAAIEYRFRIRELLKITLSAMIVFWPAIFYYLKFGTTNIIKDKGFLSTDYITFTRVFGFYFDLNQGLILAAPLLLFVYIFLYNKHLLEVFLKRKKISFELLLPLVLILVTMVVSTMINWNHGMAVVNRYVTFILPVILIHAVFLLSEYRLRYQVPVLFLVLATQVLTILYHDQEKFNKWDWKMVLHKPISKYVIEHYPSLYNPDPMIFITRTNGNYNYSPDISPVIYQKRNGEIPKILVHKEKLTRLEDQGINLKNEKKLNFINGWAYANEGDFILNIPIEKVRENIHIMKRDNLINKMRSSPDWLKTIENKADARGISLEEMLVLDAEYLMSLEE